MLSGVAKGDGSGIDSAAYPAYGVARGEDGAAAFGIDGDGGVRRAGVGGGGHSGEPWRHERRRGG